MLNLIRKDLIMALSNRFYIISTLLFPLLLMFLVDFKLNEQIIAIMIYAMSSFLLNLSFYYEEKSKPQILIQSLPIRKREIVFSKYLMVFFCYLIGIIYVGLALWLAKFLGYSLHANINIPMIKITLPIVLIHQSIILPLSFGISDRLANAISTGLLVFVNNTYLTYNFERTSRRLLNNSNRFSVALIVILILVISNIVSIVLYENKELT